jgi:hypothetical protein
MCGDARGHSLGRSQDPYFQRRFLMVLRRPTYAQVTSTLALFFALGGGAYAAATLPANSVGPSQIKKNAVERAKIKDNAVDASKVRDNTLSGADIKESMLEQVPLAATADNATHATLAAGLDKISYRSATATAPPMADTAATAACDPGQHVIGGGVRVDNPAVALVDDSYPDAGGTAWTAHIGTGSLGGTNFTVTAICVVSAAAG